jgi:hypothetical protein
MKFKVERTSLFNGDEKPCENAFKEKYTRVDERTIDDPSKNEYTKNWYENGTNHRVENGHIKRDFVEEGWFMEISTLGELMQFIKDNGEDVVIGELFHNQSIIKIEIYDDYRE